MKTNQFYLLMIFVSFLSMNKVNAQCTAQDVFFDDFESYTQGAQNCWSGVSNATYFGVRNHSQSAYSGSRYLYLYTLNAVGDVSYFISPEISTIDGEHFAKFFIASNFSNVQMEYGTMSNRTDVSTFISMGTHGISNTYQEVTTAAISQNEGHKYFAIKLTSPSQHTIIALDDFSWNAPAAMATSEVDKDFILSFFPNPVTDILNIQSEHKIQEISIQNMNGEIVYHHNTCFSNRMEVNMSSFNKGVYIVTVLSQNKKENFKIIKK